MVPEPFTLRKPHPLLRTLTPSILQNLRKVRLIDVQEAKDLSKPEWVGMGELVGSGYNVVRALCLLHWKCDRMPGPSEAHCHQPGPTSLVNESRGLPRQTLGASFPPPASFSQPVSALYTFGFNLLSSPRDTTVSPSHPLAVPG